MSINIQFRIIQLKTPYSVQIQENKDQKNFVFWHFSRSVFPARTIASHFGVWALHD